MQTHLASLMPGVPASGKESDHRAILDVLGALRDACSAGDLAAARRALATLHREVSSHFAAEEALMETVRYPDRARHKAAHGLFTSQVAALAQHLESASAAATGAAPAIGSLRVWVELHVLVNDLQLARFLGSPDRPGAGRGLRPGRRG